MDSVLYFLIGFLIMSGIYSVFSVGLNIHWGHTGLFNIGIASFFLLGSYTAAIISSPSPSLEKYEEYYKSFCKIIFQFIFNITR